MTDGIAAGMVTISIAPARDLIALDLWAGTIADLGEAMAGVRALQVEPNRWWLVEAATHLAAIDAAIAHRGALSPFGGGMVCAKMTGAGWRDLLSIAGVFDVENPAFAVGDIASTVIHHVPVRIAVTASDACDVFCSASYAATLDRLWHDAGAVFSERVT